MRYTQIISSGYYFQVWWSFSFTLLSNLLPLCHHPIQFDDPFLLHCSQTSPSRSGRRRRFDDPFLLHCSQTHYLRGCGRSCLMILFFYTALKRLSLYLFTIFQFDDPFLLHCSQTSSNPASLERCLMILFFYTALKPSRLWIPLSPSLMILFFYTALKRHPRRWDLW